MPRCRKHTKVKNWQDVCNNWQLRDSRLNSPNEPYHAAHIILFSLSTSSCHPSLPSPCTSHPQFFTHETIALVCGWYAAMHDARTCYRRDPLPETPCPFARCKFALSYAHLAHASRSSFSSPHDDQHLPFMHVLCKKDFHRSLHKEENAARLWCTRVWRHKRWCADADADKRKKDIAPGPRAHIFPSRNHKKTWTYTEMPWLSTPCGLKNLRAVLSCVSIVVGSYGLLYWIEIKNKPTLLHFLTRKVHWSWRFSTCLLRVGAGAVWGYSQCRFRAPFLPGRGEKATLRKMGSKWKIWLTFILLALGSGHY